MGSFIKTLIGGALGLAALYLVGKVGYEMGKEDAEACEKESEDIVEVYDGHGNIVTTIPVKTESVMKPGKKVGKVGLMLGLGKLLRKKGTSTVKDILSDPDGCKVEAYVEDEAVHICVYKKRE